MRTKEGVKLGDVAAWVAIVVTVVVAAVVQLVQNKNANEVATRGINAAKAATRQAGIATAEVYLARVQLEQRGLIAMWKRGVTLNSYAPPGPMGAGALAPTGVLKTP